MFLLKEANFPVKVLRGTAAPLGKGHNFCIRDLPNAGLQGWFEFIDNGQVKQLALTQISLFEMSGGKIEVNPQKWVAPTVAAGVSLLTPLPVFLEVVGVSATAVFSGFAKTRVRFICETVTGDHFTGTLSSTGFVAAKVLWQKRVETSVDPQLSS